MDFWEHGHFSLSSSKNIIVVEAEGPFNEEIFERYHAELQNQVELANYEKWCHVAILKGLSMFTPAVLMMVEENLKWLQTKGMLSDAIVFLDAQGAHLTQEQLVEIYKKLKVHFRFFDDIDNAMAWSEANLMAAD